MCLYVAVVALCVPFLCFLRVVMMQWFGKKEVVSCCDEVMREEVT